jgi:hypothetical protein
MRTSENAAPKLSEKWFEQHLKREFGGHKEDEMGRKVRFSALHRTAPRLARDFSDSFPAKFRESLF